MSRDLRRPLLIILLCIILILGGYIRIFKFKEKSFLEEVYLKHRHSNYTILIEVDKKSLKLIDREDESILKEYAIATGKPNSPTPLGSFKIVEMGKWGEGFGTRWLGLNVAWGKYGIHGTNRPGTIGGSLSAGCIRMRNRDVEELYSLVDIDTRVVISNGIFGPFGQGFRELRPGQRGSDVLEVQKRLKMKGYYKEDLDGIYGEGMKSALISFLKDEEFPLTDTINEEIYNFLGIILMD